MCIPTQAESGSVRRLRHAWTLALAAALALGAFTIGARGEDADTMRDYQRRFQALNADDLEGHVTLALWCRDQEAWDLLVKQCNHVLGLSPDHRLAKLLLELGKSKGGVSTSPPVPGASPAPGATPAAAPAPTGLPGLLTAEQVQILKRKELRMIPAERVRVDLRNKVDERFLNFITVTQGLSPQGAIAFRKLSPSDKAKEIIRQVRAMQQAADPTQPFQDEFSEDVIIQSDPLVFSEYITRVWPIVARGCATSGCHSGPKAADPVFYNERRMTDEMHYTNYLILHEYSKGEARLVNRDYPAQSLLLIYGQPVAGNQTTVHPTQIRPIYTSPSDRNYLTIGQWISALGVPAPDYGISIRDLKK